MSMRGKKYIPDLAGFPFSDQPMVGRVLQRNLEMISASIAQGGGTSQSSSPWLPPSTPTISSNVDYLVFSGTAPASPLAGYLWYDTSEQTLAFKNDIANTTMNIGAESWVRGVNKTGSILADGKVVYVNGAQGNRPTVALSDNTVEASVDNLIGLVTAPIGINAEGNVTVFGVVNGYDTSGFTAGDSLYLDTAGGLTKTMPSATGTDLIQHVGYALNSTNNGKVLVAPRGPSHLAHLHDVLDGTPTSGYVLKGDGNRWTKFDLFGTANTWTANQTFNGTQTDVRNAWLNVYSNEAGKERIRLTVYCGDGDLLSIYGYNDATSLHVPIYLGGGYGATSWALKLDESKNATFNGTAITWSGNPTHSGNHTWSGNVTFNGNATFGNATTDTITLSSRFVSDLLPSTTNARALGSDTLRWSGVYATEVYRAGTALGTTLAGYLPLTGGTITGNLTVGDASTDTLTVEATSTFNTVASFRRTSYPVSRHTRHSLNAGSSQYGVVGIYAETAGDAPDGFGPRQYFGFTDSSVTEQLMGSIAMARNGADNTSTFKFYTYNAGSETLALTLSDTQATIAGSFTVNGNTTLGDATTDTATINARPSFYGGIRLIPTLVTGTTYTVLATDSVIYFTGTADCTMTVLDASGSGQLVHVKNLSANGSKVTLAYNSGDSVDGVTSPTLVIYPKQSVVLHDYADEKWGQL